MAHPQRRGIKILINTVIITFFACSGNLGTLDGDSGIGTCIDNDDDGYGTHCAAGPDCDDSDPMRHTNCGDGDDGGPAPNDQPGIGIFPDDGTDDGIGPSDEGYVREPWHPTDENSSNVRVDEDGALTLTNEIELTPSVWIANDDEGTVSRLDADTGQEVGRYPSLITGRNVDSDPSRTAIDFRGDCWIANRFRNTNLPGSVTKIASHLDDCIDRNGDGEIQTSQDINGDGIIDLDSEEYLDAADECILFTVSLGGAASIPRALAIAPDSRGSSAAGNAWVGLNYGERNHEERSCVELDGDTGAVLRTISLPLNPYGALASKYEGRVWFTNAGWQSNLPDNPPAIVNVDIRTGAVSERYDVEADGCTGTYGITIDAESGVWVAGHNCPRAFRFEPTTETWMTVELPDFGSSRGLVADADGWIWVAHSNGCSEARCGVVTRFRANDGSDLDFYVLPGGEHSIGVDLDANGRVWVVNKQSNSASRIDPSTGLIDEFPTGRGPYTYSDFTGHSLMLQFPRGFYRTVFESCPLSHWLRLFLDAETPEDTLVEVRVRTAESREELSEADWVGPWRTSGNLQEAPGPVPDGAFLEVEITLISTSIHGAIPRVHSIDLSYSCSLY